MLNLNKTTAAGIKRVGTSIAKVGLIISLFVLCIVVVSRQPRDYISVNSYIDSDVTYANGETKHFDDRYFGGINKGDTAVVHIRLPEQPLMENPVLTFYDFSTATEVWCGGTLLASYGQELAAKNMLIGNYRFMIDVPDSAWGSEITIILNPTENNSVSSFVGAVMYPAKNVYQIYIFSDPIGFVISLALLVFGTAGLFACALAGMWSKRFLNSVYIAIFALLISFWHISNRMSYGLFGFSSYFWQPMEYIAGYTVSIPILMFYRGLADKGSRWRKIFGFSAAVITAVFAVATILNFTNILHYNAFMSLESAMIVISGVLLMIYTFRMKRGGSGSETLLKTGMTIFASACIYEVVIMLSFSYSTSSFLRRLPTLISAGALCLLLCMTGAFISDLYERQKAAIATQIRADALNGIIAATPAGICQLGVRKDIPVLSANDIYYDILGISKDQTPQNGKIALLRGLSDESKEKIHKIREDILKGTAPTGSMEFTIHNTNGDDRTILARYNYDKGNSGNVIVCVMDITDRKRMEDELRVSEERYRLALTQSGRVFFFFDVKKRTMSLSDELAKLFGLPNEVDNMPDNPEAAELVEPQSVEKYRGFYERIYAGEPSGEAVISCHMKSTPDTVLWFRIAFTSVFDSGGKPSSAIIIYEDLQEERRQEIEGAWKQLNLVSVSESSYVIAQYDLTQNKPLCMSGGLFSQPPRLTGDYDFASDFISRNFIYEEDAAAYREFLSRERLLSMFDAGQFEDRMECRALQNSSAYRWTATYIQMIRDPYSNDILAQFLLKDIDEEKTGIVKMERSIDELRRELEQSRIRVMINQMQPHFLYNALSAIRTIIKTEPDYAYQLVYDFTVHLRGNIKALQSDAPIPFAEEMKNVKAYLNIEKMRMGDRLKFVYDIQCEDFSVIPLSIQPLTENAARHGIYPRGEKGGTLTVRSYETESAYVV